MKLARWLSVLPLLALVGCSTAPANTFTVPVIPAWVAPANSAPVSAFDVFTASHALAPSALLMTSDATYTRVNAKFADAAIAWTQRIVRLHGRGFVWTAESLDCDKWAKAFSLVFEISAARAGVKAQPLVARIYVNQVHAFGGVPAMPAGANGHALIAIATDEGILVVEPQSGIKTPLTQYPNRDHIWRVSLGG